MSLTITTTHHADAWFEGVDKASPCEACQVANEAEAKRQLLKEFENFQPLSDKLFGYMNNDDLIAVDVDATSARY